MADGRDDLDLRQGSGGASQGSQDAEAAWEQVPAHLRDVMVYVLRAIAELEYGTVQITVHERQVTQIERIEKRRFPLRPAQAEGGARPGGTRPATRVLYNRPSK